MAGAVCAFRLSPLINEGAVCSFRVHRHNLRRLKSLWRLARTLNLELGIGGQPLRFSVLQHMICVATVLHCAVRHRGKQKTVSLRVACDGVAASPLCKLCFGHDGSTAGNSVRLEDRPLCYAWRMIGMHRWFNTPQELDVAP